MKLSVKSAGICWSLTFLVTAVPGFFQQTKPTDFNTMATGTFSGLTILETLGLSLIGSAAAGILGYMIGDILSCPQNHPKNKKKKEKEQHDLAQAQSVATAVTNAEAAPKAEAPASESSESEIPAMAEEPTGESEPVPD